MNRYKVRLFGGMSDGKTGEITESLLVSKHILVPTPRTSPVFVHDPVDDLAPGYDVEQYSWDGTVNEQGEYRFRSP